MLRFSALLCLLLASCAPRLEGAPPAGRRVLALLHLADLHSHLFPDRVTLTARDVDRGLGSGRGGSHGDAAVGDSVMVGGAARLATLLDEERSRADVAVTLDA